MFRFSRIKLLINWVSNMGLRYLIFRSYYEAISAVGYMKFRFPSKPKKVAVNIGLDEWRNTSANFFFKGKEFNDFLRKWRNSFNSLVPVGT